MPILVIFVLLIFFYKPLESVTTRYVKVADLSWQVATPTLASFTNAQPQLAILPSKFGSDVTWRVLAAPDGKCMGIKMTPEQILETAYRAAPWLNGVRTRVETVLPEGNYDFICNLSQNPSNALQKAIAQQFGLTASRKNLETNVLVLSVLIPDAPGLKRDTKNGRQAYKPGHWILPGQPIKTLANQIDHYFDLPVIDQTGLTGKFTINLKWDDSGIKSHSLSVFNNALVDQLGLELTPKIMPVEMLVIEKAK